MRFSGRREARTIPRMGTAMFTTWLRTFEKVQVADWEVVSGSAASLHPAAGGDRDLGQNGAGVRATEDGLHSCGGESVVEVVEALVVEGSAVVSRQLQRDHPCSDHRRILAHNSMSSPKREAPMIGAGGGMAGPISTMGVWRKA